MHGEGIVIDCGVSAEDLVSEAIRLRRREERPIAFAAVELPPPGDGEFNFEHRRVIRIQYTPGGGLRGIEHFLAKLGEGYA